MRLPEAGNGESVSGLTYDELSRYNPKIVCGHISAYGRDNPRASRPGYDFLMQAEAGLMSITGDPDGDPARFGPSIIDFMTGMTLAVGLLSAIIGARNTGEGRPAYSAAPKTMIASASRASSRDACRTTWYDDHAKNTPKPAASTAAVQSRVRRTRGLAVTRGTGLRGCLRCSGAELRLRA